MLKLELLLGCHQSTFKYFPQTISDNFETKKNKGDRKFQEQLTQTKTCTSSSWNSIFSQTP